MVVYDQVNLQNRRNMLVAPVRTEELEDKVVVEKTESLSIRSRTGVSPNKVSQSFFPDLLFARRNWRLSAVKRAKSTMKYFCVLVKQY